MQSLTSGRPARIYPLPAQIAFALLPMIGSLHAQTAEPAPAASATAAAASAPSAGSSTDCSTNFFDRLTAAYREDANPAPTDPNAPATPRRAMASPFSSPPFP